MTDPEDRNGRIALGSKHCLDCGILFWEKDMRKDRCIDCVIKYYEKELKDQKQPSLFENKNNS